MPKSSGSPDPIVVTYTGSVGEIQLSSKPTFTPSFFIQALPSNTSYILVGNACGLVASTAIMSLDSGGGATFEMDSYFGNGAVFDLNKFWIVALATTDQATITYFE